MNRKNPLTGWGNDLVIGVATYVGGGNGADLEVPGNDDYPKITNLAYTGARTGEGVYECVLVDGPPQMLAVLPVCAGAGHRAEVTTDYDPATRMVVVTTRNSAGTADDLPTTDALKLVCVCRDSTA